MNNYIKISIAFAAGAIAGTITGILLAPDKGEATREMLAKRARAFEAEFKEMATNCKRAVCDSQEKLMKEAEAVFS